MRKIGWPVSVGTIEIVHFVALIGCLSVVAGANCESTRRGVARLKIHNILLGSGRREHNYRVVRKYRKEDFIELKRFGQVLGGRMDDHGVGLPSIKPTVVCEFRRKHVEGGGGRGEDHRSSPRRDIDIVSGSMITRSRNTQIELIASFPFPLMVANAGGGVAGVEMAIQRAINRERLRMGYFKACDCDCDCNCNMQKRVSHIKSV